MTDHTSEKKKRERSAAYPAIPLEEAIKLSVKLKSSYGKSQFSREMAVQAMGYKTVTGSSGTKVGTLVHYGLLARNGGAYTNSNLADRICHPIDEKDRHEAIRSAAMKPKLFKALISEFSGRAIPSALNNLLIRNHGIAQKVSDDVVKVFRKTIEFAGLCTNGIIENNEQVDTLEESSLTTPASPETVQKDTPHAQPNTSQGMQSTALPCGIIISYPADMGYRFAIGEFGKEIAALNAAAVTKNNDLAND